MLKVIPNIECQHDFLTVLDAYCRKLTQAKMEPAYQAFGWHPKPQEMRVAHCRHCGEEAPETFNPDPSW